MNPIEICIAFIAAIVSVGTPLVFQVISKFDEKYHSEKIMELFKKESFQRILIAQIIVVTILSILYIVASLLYCETDFLKFNLFWKIVSFLLIILSFTLIAHFIYFSLVVLKFSVPSTFIAKRTNWLKRSGKKEHTEYFEAISDLFVSSIRLELINTCNLMPDYMDYVFKNYGNLLSTKFPDEYYYETQRISEELALSKSPRLKVFDNYATGFHWYFKTERIIFTDTTFKVLWGNLNTIIEFQKDEIIFQYWRQAFHFIQYDLRLPNPIYDNPLSSKKINQEEIDSVTAKRKEFIEFHYYLGSLLLFENRIDCIRKIWSYTTSQPPKYPLLPITLDEIFSEYFKACSYFDKNRWEKSSRFKFPTVDSIQSDSIIDSWYRKYFLLLFLRQYTLHYNVNFVEPVKIPEPPTKIDELKYHLDKIETLESELTRLLDPTENIELLEGLKLDFITEEWCAKKDKLPPNKLIAEYKAKLVSKLGEVKESQELIPYRIDQFYNRSKEILEKTFDEYFGEGMDIFVIDLTNELKRKLPIKNNELLPDREPFVDESISLLNYDSIHASRFSKILNVTISESFLLAISKQYLLNEKDVYPAIQKLAITENPKEFMIVCFQQAPSYYQSVYNISGLSDNEFKGVKIYNFNICNPELVADTYFIFKKEHRPIVKFNKTENLFESNYYHRDLILEKYNLAASIVDLKRDGTIRQEYEEKTRINDLDTRVLTIFEINAEISWKDEAKVIAIRVASANKNLGIPSKLDDIKPFDKI